MLPFALVLLATALPPAWRSLWALERFPESLSPGYFAIRLALVLLAVLLGAQALASLRRRRV